VEESVFFKDFEEYMLKLDSLLTRLRKQIGNFLKGRSEFQELKPNLIRLRNYNKSLNRLLSETSKPLVSAEYRELVITLVEFLVSVALIDEREIISTLRKSLKSRDALNVMDKVEESLEKLELSAKNFYDEINAS